MVCILLNPSHSGCSDSPFRHVKNPSHSQIIGSIVNCFHVRKKIFNLLSGIKVHPANDLVRNVCKKTFFLKKSGLGVCPVKDRTVTIAASAFPVPGSNISHHILSFLKTVHKLAKMDFFSLGILCPQSFGLSLRIICDHFICRIQDILG